MKFPYRKMPIDPSPSFPLEKVIFRPIIPISLKVGNNSLRYEALIDSGADYNIFPAELGRILGLEVESGKINTIFGISGVPIPVYFHEIILEIGGWPFNVLVGFADGVNQNQGILGQRGFFDLFKVKFNYKHYEVEVTKYEII